MGHKIPVAGCGCLGCGSTIDRAAAVILSTISHLEEAGCPAGAIGPALALALVTVGLYSELTPLDVHTAVNKALPRAADYVEWLRKNEQETSENVSSDTN
jgi:hypothetical protein